MYKQPSLQTIQIDAVSASCCTPLYIEVEVWPVSKVSLGGSCFIPVRT